MVKKLLTPEDIDFHCGWAKTYVNFNDIEALKSEGLIKGGSEDNAFVIRDDIKCFRKNFKSAHKIVDLILALLSHALRGQVYANLPSHTYNQKFIRFLAE